MTFDADCVKAVRDAAERLGYSHRDIVSGAGHDACWINRVAPTAMVMCPCVDGLSHNEDEKITQEWADGRRQRALPRRGRDGGDRAVTAVTARAPQHDRRLLSRLQSTRDVDAALEHLAPEVDWPNAMTGGRVHGRAAVRDYWLKQWKEIDPTVEPMRIEAEADGTTRVRVDQLVSSLDGKILLNKQVEHVYEFEGPFISRMTIVDVAPR